jgi:hypothetical protein
MATTTTLVEKTFDKIAAHKTTESKRDPDLWRPGSPIEEARVLFRLVDKNGDTVESLRELICVNDRELTVLQEWAAFAPLVVAVGIESMVHFREKVLEEFNRLVENAHRGDSSRPLSA